LRQNSLVLIVYNSTKRNQKENDEILEGYAKFRYREIAFSKNACCKMASIILTFKNVNYKNLKSKWQRKYSELSGIQMQKDDK
jgi:hypothetical protein